MDPWPMTVGMITTMLYPFVSEMLTGLIVALQLGIPPMDRWHLVVNPSGQARALFPHPGPCFAPLVADDLAEYLSATEL